jgi:5-methylcytosine-specific restriction endonuclease McrA
MQGHIERGILSARTTVAYSHKVAPVVDCALGKYWDWNGAGGPISQKRVPITDEWVKVDPPTTPKMPLTRRDLTKTSRILTSDLDLRAAMHRAFHGKCQMCYRDLALSYEMEIDHIFPTSKTVDDIRQDLIVQGLESVHADAFLARRWHGTHDCVLNYTVLCSDCNLRKTNDTLDVAALSLMFTYTAKQADEVIAQVNARSC